MCNDRRFFVKLLGVFMIEIRNVTPEKVIRLLWHITAMVCVVVAWVRLPEILAVLVGS